MAGIDKTYIKSWKQYAELKDFFASCDEVTDDYGNVFRPIDYLWEREEIEFKETVERLAKEVLECYKKGGYDWSLEHGYMTQEEYDNFNPYDHVSIPVMNTPIVFDIWMIRNCQHIGWLQDDLKDKYSGGWSKTAFTEHNDDDLYYQILNHTSCYDTKYFLIKKWTFWKTINLCSTWLDVEEFFNEMEKIDDFNKKLNLK